MTIASRFAYLARLAMPALFLLGCSSTDTVPFKAVKCPLDDGYYMGDRQLEPGALEVLVRTAKAHCKKQNRCLLAITDNEIICRVDFSTEES